LKSSDVHIVSVELTWVLMVHGLQDQGVQMIKCLIAEAGERNELRLTGRELRLCG
jgi:hypothetical protein